MVLPLKLHDSKNHLKLYSGFQEEPYSRMEDFITGFTWRRYMLETGTRDPKILIHFPSVKASIFMFVL